MARAERLATRTPDVSRVEMTNGKDVTETCITVLPRSATTSSEGQPTTGTQDIAATVTHTADAAIITSDASYVARSHRGSMDVVFVDFEMELEETAGEKKRRERKEKRGKGQIEGET